MNIKSYLAEKSALVEKALEKILGDLPSDSRVAAAMSYSVRAGGKRIRPILCIAAAEAVGGRAKDVMDAACALELVHTFSLIHDDLPGLDNDDLRRGKPTCHNAFDEATAILAGDALLNLAFEMLTEKADGDADELARRFRVIHAIAKGVGLSGMIEGQMHDILAEKCQLDLAELEIMHGLKTGALIFASVFAGACMAKARPEQLEALEKFSRLIGLAFQVADDILNVMGDPAIMGKAAGTDAARGKSTYPALLGLDGARAFGNSLVADALEALSGFDEKSAPLAAIARYIMERTH